jgi:hypothetical protein
MRLREWIVASAVLLGFAGAASAEGTAQLGANQDVRQETEIKVDVLTAGEVINIAVGNDSDSDPSPVIVAVNDPSGNPVTGSPFSVGPGQPGWLPQPNQLPPATITNPLQITNTVVGAYTVKFTNTRSDLSGADLVVDPLDITVTPTASTPVQPANPPGGFSRVHSLSWRMNAHDSSNSTDAAFYVLTKTGATTDHVWKLQFAGLAGFFFDVAGNDVGMPTPNSGFSIEEETALPCKPGYLQGTVGGNPICIARAPTPTFEVYLGVPDIAKGGSATPTITNFTFSGPNSLCKCAVATLNSTFSFDSNVEGTYQLVIDIDQNSIYDPATDVVLAGTAQAGSNTITWDGNDNQGNPVAANTYNAQLSLRLGEFHFIGRDIENATPGLRIFSVDVSNRPTVTESSTLMYWNDTRINDFMFDGTTAIAANAKSLPATTLPNGLSSGNPADPPICGNKATGGQTVNAHCWGDGASR